MICTMMEAALAGAAQLRAIANQSCENLAFSLNHSHMSPTKSPARSELQRTHAASLGPSLPLNFSSTLQAQ
jgi:hypothetical protein